MISKTTTCERCASPLSNKQVRWCSPRCSKLGLKSEWRKRNRERLHAYAREYREAKNGGNRSITQPSKFRDSVCLYCGTSLDLQVAHVKPLWAGGQHKWIVTFCRKHHHQFDNLLREWWKDSLATNSLCDADSAPTIAKQIIKDMEMIQ